MVQCANADINMEEYVPGCGDALWSHETDSARVRFVTNVGYTEEEIEKVSEKSEEIITAYIRRKEGEAGRRKNLLAILIFKFYTIMFKNL